VLDLANFPDAAFMFQNIAGTDIDAADFHGVFAFNYAEWRSFGVAGASIDTRHARRALAAW